MIKRQQAASSVAVTTGASDFVSRADFNVLATTLSGVTSALELLTKRFVDRDDDAASGQRAAKQQRVQFEEEEESGVDEEVEALVAEVAKKSGQQLQLPADPSAAKHSGSPSSKPKGANPPLSLARSVRTTGGTGSEQPSIGPQEAAAAQSRRFSSAAKLMRRGIMHSSLKAIESGEFSKIQLGHFVPLGSEWLSADSSIDREVFSVGVDGAMKSHVESKFTFSSGAQFLAALSNFFKVFKFLVPVCDAASCDRFYDAMSDWTGGQSFSLSTMVELWLFQKSTVESRDPDYCWCEVHDLPLLQFRLSNFMLNKSAKASQAADAKGKAGVAASQDVSNPRPKPSKANGVQLPDVSKRQLKMLRQSETPCIHKDKCFKWDNGKGKCPFKH